MVKPWLAGVAGLLMTSGVAVAQVAPNNSSTTTTTVQTTPAPVYAPVYQVAPSATTTTRVDHATSDENGLLTEHTRTTKTESVTPTVVVPPTTQTTTVERTVTTQPQ